MRSNPLSLRDADALLSTLGLMAQFLVKGVNRSLRSDITVIVEADSADNARVKAVLEGNAVTSVAALDRTPLASERGPRSCNTWAVMLLSVVTLSI